MRSDDTRQWVVDSFVDILEEGPTGKVTMEQVTKRSGVSSATCYRIFGGGVDAIASWVVDQVVAKLAPAWDEPLMLPDDQYDITSMLDFTEDACIEWYENRRVISALLSGGYADLLRDGVLSLSLLSTARFEWSLVNRDGSIAELTPVQKEYFVYTNACSMFGIIECWAKRGFVETPQEIAEMIFMVRGLDYHSLSRPVP